MVEAANKGVLRQGLPTLAPFVPPRPKLRTRYPSPSIVCMYFGQEVPFASWVLLSPMQATRIGSDCAKQAYPATSETRSIRNNMFMKHPFIGKPNSRVRQYYT